MSTYLEELNQSQRDAVLYTDGPSLVIAGAGSGKTRVLTYKIVHLLKQGIAPWNILALTFTNKAAKEMRERIGTLVDSQTASRLWMGTFHSIFARILRREAERIGFNSHFTIYDQNDSRSLLKTLIREMGLDDKVYKPATVNSRISGAKNRLILPDAYMANEQMQKHDAKTDLPALGKIYENYMRRCKQANAMDFDDLLLYTYLLFSLHPEVAARYADFFQYVLVDEYQDTNYAQHVIIGQLTRQRQRLCVVGDDAQSIYSFRGAEIDNILQFSQQYKDARIFKLEQNYRSTQSIVGAANDIISHNRKQIEKHVYSENSAGEPVRVFQAYSDIEEAEIVCNKIVRLMRREHFSYKDFAVLYRTNSQSRIFEETMRKRMIPYVVYGGLSFYQRKEIKDVLAYFRLTVNLHDEEALRRVINYPARGIGETSIKKIAAAAAEHDVSLWDVVCAPERYSLPVSSAIQKKLSLFCRLIQDFNEKLDEENAYQLGERIIRGSGILNDISQDASPENRSKEENIRELLNAIHGFVEESREEAGREFVSLIDYLSQVSLLSDLDTNEDDGNSEKVTLMTIHAAKGLEFDCVFIVGVEENLFPNTLFTTSLRQLEEERRLFYVAVTRARKYCFLSCAKTRFRYGKTESCTPSAFLYEALQSDYVARDEYGKAPDAERQTRLHRDEPRQAPAPSRPVASYSRKVPVSSAVASSSRKLISPEAEKLKSGCRIKHERFGIGSVVGVEGTGDSMKATVDFENTGRKQLLLKFAHFKILD